MGRAYEVRKASIQKTGAIKAKTYSTFAKEIYLAANTIKRRMFLRGQIGFEVAAALIQYVSCLFP